MMRRASINSFPVSANFAAKSETTGISSLESRYTRMQEI